MVHTQLEEKLVIVQKKKMTKFYDIKKMKLDEEPSYNSVLDAILAIAAADCQY